MSTTLCLMQSQNLFWTWHRFGTKIVQVCTKHFFVGTISAIGMDFTRTWSFFMPSLCQLCTKHFMLRTIPELDASLTQTWPVFVPSLYQTFFAKYNLYAFGVDLGQIYHYVVPNICQALID